MNKPLVLFENVKAVFSGTQRVDYGSVTGEEQVIIIHLKEKKTIAKIIVSKIKGREYFDKTFIKSHSNLKIEATAVNHQGSEALWEAHRLLVFDKNNEPILVFTKKG
jgi:hypothetical protein